MRPSTLATLVGISLLASPASADRVHLTDGAVLDGKATRQGDKVVVELQEGAITLPADAVERIENAQSDIQRFDAQLAKLAAGDVKGRLALANFCRDHQMAERERQLLQQIIELSPDHAEARARLGYVRTERGWITRDEQLRAQGMVQHDGQWMTPQQLLELQRLQAETDTAIHQRDKAQAEAEAKRLEVANREAELDRTRQTRVAEDAARAQAAAPQAPPAMYYGYAPYSVYSPYYTPYRAGYVTQPVSRPRVVHDSFPIAGAQDPWIFIRGH